MNNLHAPLMGSTVNLVPIMLMGLASASRKRKNKQKQNKQIDKMNGQADIKWEVALKINTQSKQILIEAHEYNRLIWPHILH